MKRQVVKKLYDCFIVKTGGAFNIYRSRDFIMNNGNAHSLAQLSSLALCEEYLRSF